MLAGRLSRRAAGLGVIVLAFLAAACDDSGTAGPTSLATVATTTTVAARVDDGVLRIGLLLPDSGEGATIGQALIDASRRAADLVNATGGVLGEPIEIVDGFDEGSSAASAREAIASLIERDVDAVVGPASSTIALATLDELLTAGILTCSPTATALALDDFPSRELFFRTAPSDSMQAGAIARYAEQTGARTAAIGYLDDAYGRPFADAVRTALEGRGLNVTPFTRFTAQDESLAEQATELSEGDVGVVVIVADGEQGARMLAGLGEVAERFTGTEPPVIIVNDAIRRPPSTQLVATLDRDVRERVVGVSPLAIGTDAAEPVGPFATNAFDCVNLIALSAVQAGADNPEAMAAEMVPASTLGVSCREFAACLQVLRDDLNVDYDGPGGVAEMNLDGDPARSRFDLFEFNESGVDVSRPSGMTIQR